MTSYAVSPQSNFTCPPCSVRLRQQGSEPSRRLTYCSITTPKLRLQCFSEISSPSLGQGREFHTFFTEVENAESPVVHLELLVADEESRAPIKNKLLAIHTNGEMRCFSRDLQVEEWKTKIDSESGGVIVEFATVISLEEAQQSLLKNREDILALLGDLADVKSISIMLLVTRPAQKGSKEDATALNFRIIQVGTSTGARIPIVELASFILPEMDDVRSDDSKYSWHGASGSLLQNNSTALLVHDLTGLVPRLRYYLKSKDDEFASCLRLSPSTIALTCEGSFSIMDMQYHSLQARCHLEPSPQRMLKAEKHESKKNTRNDCRLTSYFARLDLVTALRGRELIVIQLSSLKQTDSGSRKRKRDSLLVNSLGRAFSSNDGNFAEPASLPRLPRSLGTFLPTCRSSDDWTTKKELLDDLFAQRNFNGFEYVLATQLGVVETGTQSKVPDGTHHSSEVDSASLFKVYYALAKIFSVEKHGKPAIQNSTTPHLIISWFPSKICRWLIGEGLFSPNQIEAALKIYGSLSADQSLSFGDYTRAVAGQDKTLETLGLILRSPVPLEPNEIAHCLSQLIKISKLSRRHNDVKLVTDNNVPVVDGSEQEMQKIVIVDAASSIQQLNQESSFHRLLDSILIRLNTYARSKVSQALKAELSSLEMRSLVDLLRVQLADGQWLSSCVEMDQNPASEECPQNGQINNIATLLNCAIDSLGTGGWILGASMMEDFAETSDTIAYLKAEISAALEGIEEATSLKGMLGEILLFDDKSRARNQNQFSAEQFLSQARSSMMNLPNAGEILPLGLQVTHAVPTKRLKAGGEIQMRTSRDIARLKSHMVGKYSFDRITI